MSGTTLITLTPEELASDRKATIMETLQAIMQGVPEPLVPKEKIKQVFGIRSDEAFYNLRREKQASAVERWGNVDVYHLSDFTGAPYWTSLIQFQK